MKARLLPAVYICQRAGDCDRISADIILEMPGNRPVNLGELATVEMAEIMAVMRSSPLIRARPN